MAFYTEVSSGTINLICPQHTVSKNFCSKTNMNFTFPLENFFFELKNGTYVVS